MRSNKDYSSVPVIVLQLIVQNASLPRGHASIRIQQYVGIITCMRLVLLRANDMDREDVHVEKKVAHGNPRVSHHMVCSIHGVSMGLTAHGLLRSLMTSVDINILTSLYSALFTALEKTTGHYMVNNGFIRLLAPEDV